MPSIRWHPNVYNDITGSLLHTLIAWMRWVNWVSVKPVISPTSPQSHLHEINMKTSLMKNWDMSVVTAYLESHLTVQDVKWNILQTTIGMR